MVLVGGGLGVAPVYPQLRAFKQAGNRTTGIIGFRNKDLVFWEDKFRKYCDDLVVCTDDGSYGKPGFVTAGAQGGLREGQARPGDRHRPAADDERLRRDHPAVRREDHGVAQRHHGGRHRHVRLVPRHGRRPGEVRLRRGARLRRPPGRLQGAHRAPASASRRRRTLRERGLRARLQPREAALRGEEAQLQEDQGPRAHADQDAGARPPRSAPRTSRR